MYFIKNHRIYKDLKENIIRYKFNLIFLITKVCHSKLYNSNKNLLVLIGHQKKKTQKFLLKFQKSFICLSFEQIKPVRIEAYDCCILSFSFKAKSQKTLEYL